MALAHAYGVPEYVARTIRNSGPDRLIGRRGRRRPQQKRTPAASPAGGVRR
ncbi:hypothetical protein ABZ078_34710 [Streptomyces sp. NPDC006385]|uniref:hypothetical protein n=1 Tax=Streptomyces sp. NPDC006385 TaxID=3156761 RepID=UPI0033B37BAC